MEKPKLILLDNQVYLLRAISVGDQAKVLSLFHTCEEFFILTEGIIPINSDELYYDLPPGNVMEDKLLYGVLQDELLVGVVDIVKNYPEKGEWIIGLLLLHPKVRGMGLGKSVHNILIRIARDGGAKKLRVGVVEQNTSGYQFWAKLGYKKMKLTEPIRYSIKESKVIVMNYFL
ncbi:MAG: GNAT family N-acetyltransferase [Vallitaleaceae bacterium]|jgi:GNAT superfamily N-acetyltransferase|nr:GNAT family N-acetyltransferase [Vallitaleaceae bacterium]